MNRKLSELRSGESGVILSVQGHGATRRRLLALGLTRQIPITVTRTAPLGDPLEVSLRGYSLCIRRAEAVEITVTVEEKE